VVHRSLVAGEILTILEPGWSIDDIQPTKDTP
jgi:hypothetical protein